MRIIGWLENIALFILIGLLFYLSIPVYGQKNIKLDSPSSSAIIPQLTKKGYDVGIVDKLLMQIFGESQSGWIYLGTKKMSRIDFAYHITSKRMAYNIITLLPGETMPIFMNQLGKELDLNVSKLKQNYKRYSSFKEAGILAESYHIQKNLKENEIVKFLLEYSLKKYKDISKSYYHSWGIKKWNRILTIASIIQKEAANKSEMPIIASVIYNRLSKKMRLQMDGTLNYGKYSHIKVTPQRIKEDKTTYNTYKHRGLPKYPVCAVSLDAIKAAILPAKTPYLYFMKNDKGKHDFSLDYKTHLQNIKKKRDEIKQEGLQNHQDQTK